MFLLFHNISNHLLITLTIHPKLLQAKFIPTSNQKDQEKLLINNLTRKNGLAVRPMDNMGHVLLHVHKYNVALANVHTKKKTQKFHHLSNGLPSGI